MSTKKKPKKRPMRLWLVRDVDPDIGGGLWIVESRDEPWLYQQDGYPDVWEPDGYACPIVPLPNHGSDLAPGECVELREVHDEACHKKEVR